MKLLLTNGESGKLIITDENGKLRYSVYQDMISFLKKTTIYDDKDSAIATISEPSIKILRKAHVAIRGTDVCTAHKKFNITSFFRERYDIRGLGLPWHMEYFVVGQTWTGLTGHKVAIKQNDKIMMTVTSEGGWASNNPIELDVIEAEHELLCISLLFASLLMEKIRI